MGGKIEGVVEPAAPEVGGSYVSQNCFSSFFLFFSYFFLLSIYHDYFIHSSFIYWFNYLGPVLSVNPTNGEH